MWSKYLSNNVWRDFRLLMSALATVTGKSFLRVFFNLQLKQQIYSKSLFYDRLFYVTIADADIGSLKSLHILFVKYLERILVKFEQNRMV